MGMLQSRVMVLITIITSLSSQSWGGPVEVNVENFVRAETDQYFARYVAQGAFGRVVHVREPVSIQQQDVIRMNRDTLYSGGVFDVMSPVSITMPEGDGRFQSMQVINQDHYVVMVKHGAGTHRLSRENVGTRYAGVIVRTFMDPNDEADIAVANRLQDEIAARQASVGEFDVPDWDRESLDRVRGLLNALAVGVGGFATGAFGSREDVDPIRHLIATAAGWGGNPPAAATYAAETPARNDGKVPYVLTAGEVPVDGFWSVTVYNGDGFMEYNDRDTYSFNGVTAERNADGSVTIHFGGCDDGRSNCVPIMEDWNYVVRLYQPRKEILDGSWEFPAAVPVK
jgi:hypothetical protein